MSNQIEAEQLRKTNEELAAAMELAHKQEIEKMQAEFVRLLSALMSDAFFFIRLFVLQEEAERKREIEEKRAQAARVCTLVLFSWLNEWAAGLTYFFLFQLLCRSEPRRPSASLQRRKCVLVLRWPRYAIE